MAEVTITGLPNASTLTGAERVPMDQAGATVDASAQAIADLATAATVGLGSVNNTSDLSKPISTATQTALDLKAAASAISNINNTSDLAKPISTATQAALDLKAAASHTQAASTITGLAAVATSGVYTDLTSKPTLGTAAPLDVAATGDASATQVVQGNDSRLSDARTPVAHNQAASTITGLGTAATANTGTAAGNVVVLDGSAKLPAVDGSQLTGINTAGTDLAYTAASRLLTSSTGTDVTLPLSSSTDAGLVPASGGGTTNFLRADGTFAAPPGGSGTPGGSTTQLQFNDAGAFGGDADLTWNKTTNVLGITGDVNLSDGGTYTTTLQTITPTAARTISFPDATGTVALVAGSSEQLIYNNAGAYAGGPLFSLTTGTLGYNTGGTVTQGTNKSTGVTLNGASGRITMNGALLALDTTVSFTLTNSSITANDLLILNHVSVGTAGSYLLNAQAAAGSATINVRNISLAALSEAIVIGFAVIKA